MSVEIPLCNHMKTNGVWCGSPALRGHRYCHFHHEWRENHPNLEPEAKPAAFELPLLEDANAIQVALQRVMQAILNNQIDTRKAGLLLYALQTASANLKRTHFESFKLDEQARQDYTAADCEDACEICADIEEEDSEEEQKEMPEEVTNTPAVTRRPEPGAIQFPAVARGPEPLAAPVPAVARSPHPGAVLPEHDAELTDEDVIKAIRQLAGLK